MEEKQVSSRPNVLLLMTDDQGAWALGSRIPELQTPTLDQLQRAGTTFESAFCASPVCSPARASIMTGRMPSAHGIHDWLKPGALARTEHPHRPVVPDFLESVSGTDTIAAMLSRGGYRCGMVGKWHVGSSDQPAEGFDYWYAHQLGGGPYYGAPIWSHKAELEGWTSVATARTEPEYFTDAVTRQSIDFLSRASEDGSDTPFFLQMNWTAPHDPWFDENHPAELRSLYAETDFPSVPTPEYHEWFVRDRFRRATSDRRGALAGYFASLSGVDRSVETVLDWLEQRGLLTNTIVIFTSDNGFSCGHHGIWGKGNATWPLNFWEPSITVPLIVRWDGRVTAGKSVDVPVSTASLLETIGDLVGASPLSDPLRAGESMATLLCDGTGGSAADDRIVIHDEYGANRMIRSDHWKLVVRRDGPGELFNLFDDPDEGSNRYGDVSLQRMARSLQDEMESWFNEHAVPELSGWSVAVDGTGQEAPVGRHLFQS